MVRYRGAVEVRAEEVEATDATPSEVSPEEVSPAEVMVYTDDWENDLADLPPFEEEEINQK